MAKRKADGKRTKPTKAKIKTWLKGKGHDSKKVDDEVGGKDERGALLALHNVKLSEWQAAGGQ